MAAGNFNLGKASGGILNVSPADGTTNTSLVLPASGTVVATDASVTDNAIARYDGNTGKLQDSGVVIDDSGNVGVGTSSPYYKIHIVGNPSYNGVLRIEAGGTTTTDAVLDLTARGSNGVYNNAEIRAIGSTGKGTTLEFYTDNPAGPITRQMSLNSSGNLLLTSGTGGLGYGTGAGGTVTQLTSKSTAVTLNKPSGQITMNGSALAPGASVTFNISNSLLGLNDIVNIQLIGGTSVSSNYRIENLYAQSNLAVISITNTSAGSLSEALILQFSIIKGANS